MAHSVQSVALVLLLMSLIVTISVIAYFSLGSSLANKEKSSGLNQSLDVSINPSGPVQLTTQQVQVFEANTNNTDSSLSYTWSIENSSRSSVANGTHYLLLVNDNQAVFKFLNNLVDYCWISAKVNSTSLAENTAIVQIQNLKPQSTEETFANQQATNELSNQQTQSQNTDRNDNYQIVYLNSSSFPKFIIQTDSPSNYQVINGIDGSIVTEYSSTSANATLNSAIALGGIIAIKSGDYSGAQLNVPSNTNIIAESSVTGIKYASIADGVRINEPAFNAAFGSYQSGNYTVTSNSTSSATDQTLCLAFRPDNTIYYASNNASYVLNSLASQAGSIFIKGNITLTSPIILSKRGTSLFSDRTGQLWFIDSNGLYITANEVNVFDLDLRQTYYERTKTGITYLGNSINPIAYEKLSNVELWGWNTALSMNYTSSSQFSNLDTTYSYTGLNIWGQSVNNFFSNCQFSNFGKNQTTVLIRRDESLNTSPEGNIIANSLIYGGNIAIDLQYTFATQISNSIIDGWTEKGVRIIGSQDNTLSDNWIGCYSLSSNSIAVEVNSDSFIIRGNTLSAYNSSIYVYSSKNFLINGNSFKFASSTDIYSINNNGGSIINNIFCSSSKGGIIMQKSYGFSIYGNIFTGQNTAVNIITSNHNSIVSNIINGTQETAIILDDSKYNTLASNSIYNSGQKTNNSYSDIWLVNNSTYNNVCYNSIIALNNNKSVWGILESSLTDDYNMYSGNTLRGQVSGAIGIKGVHSIRGENVPTSG